jgi:hypothetical protein
MGTRRWVVGGGGGWSRRTGWTMVRGERAPHREKCALTPLMCATASLILPPQNTAQKRPRIIQTSKQGHYILLASTRRIIQQAI